MRRILMIVGSMRKESFNKKLALVAKELISDRAEVSFLEYKDIPPMNQDIEYPAPEEIERVRREVKSADGIWFMTAEYNYSYPGVLKNLLDWLSRPLVANDPERMTAVVGKKVTICGVGGKNMTSTVRERLVDMLTFMRMELVGGAGKGFALPPSAFASGEWEPEQEVVDAINQQATELLAALE